MVKANEKETETSSFRQTAMRTMSGFAPAAGLGECTGEKMGRQL